MDENDLCCKHPHFFPKFYPYRKKEIKLFPPFLNPDRDYTLIVIQCPVEEEQEAAIWRSSIINFLHACHFAQDIKVVGVFEKKKHCKKPNCSCRTICNLLRAGFPVFLKNYFSLDIYFDMFMITTFMCKHESSTARAEVCS